MARLPPIPLQEILRYRPALLLRLVLLGRACPPRRRLSRLGRLIQLGLTLVEPQYHLFRFVEVSAVAIIMLEGGRVLGGPSVLIKPSCELLHHSTSCSEVREVVREYPAPLHQYLQRVVVEWEDHRRAPFGAM